MGALKYGVFYDGLRRSCKKLFPLWYASFAQAVRFIMKMETSAVVGV